MTIIFESQTNCFVFHTFTKVFHLSFVSCLDALAACNYLPQSREKIIAALFKALNSTNNELQEAGEACMRKVSAATSTCVVVFISISFKCTCI